MTFTNFNPDNLPMFLMKNNTIGNRPLDAYEAQGCLFSNEIKSVTDIEIWQKFLLFFIQEAHLFSEFDMGNNENPLESTTNFSRLEMDIPDEEGEVRNIAMSDWSIRKQK